MPGSTTPLTGPKREDRASIEKALAEWCDIFGGISAAQAIKNLKANTTEAVDLECEHRGIPKGSKKVRFPYLRPRFLGEAVFTDTISWKDSGTTKYGQTFLTQASNYPYFVDLPKGQSGMAEAYREFFTEVGVPTIMVADQHQSENKSKKVRKLCRSYHVKIKFTEPEMSHQNKVERLNGWLGRRVCR